MSRPVSVPCSEIRAGDPRPAGWWCSATGGGSLDMRGLTLGVAIAELLAQCGEEYQRREIVSGTMTIDDQAGDIAGGGQ